MDRYITCNLCSREYFYSRKDRKGSSTTTCASCTVRKARHRKKAKAVEYMGGKCTLCGYNRSNRALTFHHHSNNKEFSISQNIIKKWDELKIELDKCVLLCFNCHMETHDKRWESSSTVEQHSDMVKAEGSIPSSPTKTGD